jgi:hypothetical protein
VGTKHADSAGRGRVSDRATGRRHRGYTSELELVPADRDLAGFGCNFGVGDLAADAFDAGGCEFDPATKEFALKPELRPDFRICTD